jgi:tetratricopeptide (TPR) repeat protein
MKTEADVLSALSERLSPGELTQVVRRLLHVPEAWAYLHEEGVLERRLAAGRAGALTPWSLALDCLGMPETADVRSRLPEPYESRLGMVGVEAPPSEEDDPHFETVALACVSVVRRAATPDGIRQVAEAAQADPPRWMSPLACAWPKIEDQGALLTALLSGAGSVPAGFAANMLMANLTADKAVEGLLSVSETAELSVVAVLREIGQTGAPELASPNPAIESASKALDPGLDRLANKVVKAYMDRMRGEVESSRSLLEDAWESANELLANVSDQVANGAHEDQEPVVEIEARRRSLETRPSAQRRAWLADAFTRGGRPEEALALLADSTTGIEEQIAAASAFLALDEASSASERLGRGAPAGAAGPPPRGGGRAPAAKETALVEPYWIHRFAEAAVALGQSATAIEWAEREVEIRPASLEARRNLASIQSAAGDFLAAADQARIVQALDPSDLKSLQLLASNLRSAGDPTGALPYWRVLAAADPSHLEALAECALASGEHSIAEDAARRALEASPKSHRSMVHLGRALMALGDPKNARQHIEEATKLNPDSADGWIALAEAQAAEGDHEGAGKTLCAAAQSVLGSADLHMAHARWLTQDGRLSEALEAAERAIELSPGQPSWLVEQGDLLLALGHTEKALGVFEQAAQKWPGNWEARQALAKAYESADKFVEAQDAVGNVPDNASAESRILAGRIVVKAAAASGDARRIADALAIFDSMDPADPEAGVWAGRALILAARPDEAVRRFLGCLPKSPDEITDLDQYLACVLGLAEAAIANDQPDVAVSQLESARAVVPSSAELFTGLSTAYQAAGLLDHAIQAAEKACALAPDEPAPLQQLAHVSLEDRRWDRALGTLAKLVLIAPESPEIELDIARASLGVGDIQRARDSLASAIFAGRRNPDVLRRGADVLLDLGSAPSAKRLLLTAAQNSRPDSDLLAKLAEVSTMTGDAETALWAWKGRAALDPQDSRAAKQIATSLDTLGRRGEAIGYWEKALKLSPDDPTLPAILARATLEAGDIPAAMRHFEAALERSPQDVDLALEAGIAQLRHGSPDSALTTLQAAAAISPDRADVLAALGEARLQADKPQEAVEALRTATEAEGVLPAHLALLALAELAGGDLNASETSLDRALEIAPESADDVMKVSRAALKLSRWDAAIGTIERWLSANDDPLVLRTWLTTRLRLADARSLYAASAEAVAHAPSSVWEGDVFLQGMQASFDRAERHGVIGDDLAVLRSRALAAAGSAEEADLEALESAAVNDPSGETSEGLAIAYLRAGRPVDALRAMLPDPGKRPVGEWAALIIGIGQAAMGRHEQARQAFSYAASNPAVMPLAEYLSGRAFLDSGMRDKAIAHFNKALASWPDEAAWHFKLAHEYMADGDPSAALPHLQHAAEQSPQDGDYLLELARAYRAVGQLDEAEGVYGRAVHAFPEQSEVWREAGQLALALHKPDNAVIWFDRACHISPDDPLSLVGAARAALALGRTREAREHSLAAQQVAPDDPDVQMAVADVLASQGKVDKALMSYDRALERATDPTPVRLARSNLLVRAGRAAEAVESLKSLTLTAGEDDGIWASLAEAARAAGDMDLALNAVEQAVRLSPRNTNHRLMLARISREAGHLDRALSELSQIDAGSSHDPSVAVEIGHLHEDRRELKRALDAYERAIDLDPSNAEAHYRAGLVLKNLKAYEQAGAMLKRAVELNPRSPDVLHQLAAVRALELVHGGIRQTAVP